MGVTAVFIDGGYLDKVLHFDHGDARPDFELMAKVLSQPDDLLRVYYYHCLPYQGNPPSQEEKESILIASSFCHEALASATL